MPRDAAPEIDISELQEALCAYALLRWNKDPFKFGSYWCRNKQKAPDPAAILDAKTLVQQCLPITKGTLRLRTKELASAISVTMSDDRLKGLHLNIQNCPWSCLPQSQQWPSWTCCTMWEGWPGRSRKQRQQTRSYHTQTALPSRGLLEEVQKAAGGAKGVCQSSSDEEERVQSTTDVNDTLSQVPCLRKKSTQRAPNPRKANKTPSCFQLPDCLSHVPT